MTTKKGFLSRIFRGEKGNNGTQKNDCCAIQIEEVPSNTQRGEQTEAMSGSQGSTRSEQPEPTNAGEQT